MQASESQRRLNSSRAPWQQQHRHRRQAAVLVQLQWRDGNDVFHTFMTVRVSLWYLLLVCGCFYFAGMYCGSVVTDSANCVCAHHCAIVCVCSALWLVTRPRCAHAPITTDQIGNYSYGMGHDMKVGLLLVMPARNHPCCT